MGQTDVEAGIVVPLHIFGHQVEALEVLGGGIKVSVSGEERTADVETLPLVVQERKRSAYALGVELSYFERGIILHAVFRLEGNVSGCGQVAFGDVVGTFIEINGLYGFRLKKMQVGIFLPVGV